MGQKFQEEKWFWATLTLSSVSIMGFVFLAWELVESRFFRDVDYLTLHYLYISRGIVSSLLLGFWAAWFVLRERRSKEQQLSKSREHYRNLLNASPNAVVLYDSNLRVCEWNTAAGRLYGFDKEEIVGNPLPTVPASHAAELAALMQQVSAGEAVLDVETKRQSASGHALEVSLSLLPFHENSSQAYFLEVTSDIRERVHLRQRLLHIEKLATMGQMAAGTAHHLNTPLATILLRLAMMRQGAFEDSLGAELKRLEDSVRFCQQFVRRLLDFTRLPQPSKSPEVLGSIIEAVASFFRPQLVARSVRLDLDLTALEQAKVLADRTQLEALLLILLTNSLDAVGSDGMITICCRTDDSCRAEICVRDNGRGIDAAALPHIFEPFFTTKPPGKGTGLGLAIAANIMQEHAGSIRLESTPGVGTTAYVEMPLWREPMGGGRQ